jgi:hypothetical protein
MIVQDQLTLFVRQPWFAFVLRPKPRREFSVAMVRMDKLERSSAWQVPIASKATFIVGYNSSIVMQLQEYLETPAAALLRRFQSALGNLSS